MLAPIGTYFSACEVWLLLSLACVVQSRVYHMWLGPTFIMCGSIPCCLFGTQGSQPGSGTHL